MCIGMNLGNGVEPEPAMRRNSSSPIMDSSGSDVNGIGSRRSSSRNGGTSTSVINAARMIRQASSRRFMRQQAALVRDTAANEVWLRWSYFSVHASCFPNP